MDLFSLGKLFRNPDEYNSPGARLHLYRILQLLASEEAEGSTPLVSYKGAKNLAGKMGLNSPERLIQIFDDLSLGKLYLDLGHEKLTVTLTPRSHLPAPDSVSRPTCELERGLIDGALESYLGTPVTTIETSCWARGDRSCRFEASLETTDGMQAFKPVAAGGRARSAINSLPEVTNNNPSELRSWYLDAVAREMARSKRHDYAMSLLYLDLDDLGFVNEAHGKAAGDQIINAVADSLSRSCRPEDILWHHGEDEFIAVLAETDTGCAEVVARRLITEVPSAAEYVDFPASVSASIGFATYPSHADTFQALLKRAHSALYMAKSMGKARAQAAWDEAGIKLETTHRECEKGGDSLFDWPAYRPDRRKTKSDLKSPDIMNNDEQNDEVEEIDIISDIFGQSEGIETIDAVEEDEDIENLDVPDSVDNQETEYRPEADEPAKEKTEGITEVRSSREIKALAASLSPLLLEGMQKVLTSESGISIVGEVKDPSKLANMIADLKPDLVFVDQEMAVADQFAGIRVLKEENPDGKFMIFAAGVDQDVLRAAVDYDVDGIIFQDTSKINVVSSIRDVINGQRLFPSEVQSAIDELEQHRLLLKELSEREIEVLKLMAAGKSNSQISKELFITVNTVRFHLANIYQKLNVSNRTEAANYYLKQAPDDEGLA